MSSQPDEKPRDIPDALVNELLRSQGLRNDAHVRVKVRTTRIRLNSDGRRTVLSGISSSRVGRGLASMRRPSKLVSTFMATIGFVQLSYGSWAASSDAHAARLIRGNESCQLARLTRPTTGAQLSSTSPAAAPQRGPCQLEKAIVVNPYASSSRHGTTYHVVTVRPDGSRDNTSLATRGAYRFWKRMRPNELITVQRFVTPGYQLSGEVLALSDSAGVALSPLHPDSGAYPNAVSILAGGLLLVLGVMTFPRKLHLS